MADIVDIGNERAQEILDDALARVPKPKVIKGIGICINPNCGEPLDDERRWCGPECRDEYETHQKRTACRSSTTL